MEHAVAIARKPVPQVRVATGPRRRCAPTPADSLRRPELSALARAPGFPRQCANRSRLNQVHAFVQAPRPSTQSGCFEMLRGSCSSSGRGDPGPMPEQTPRGLLVRQVGKGRRVAVTIRRPTSSPSARSTAASGSPCRAATSYHVDMAPHYGQRCDSLCLTRVEGGDDALCEIRCSGHG